VLPPALFRWHWRGTRRGDKAFALGARPEAERLVLAVKLARKREEMLGIWPVSGGEASIYAGFRAMLGGGPLRLLVQADAISRLVPCCPQASITPKMWGCPFTEWRVVSPSMPDDPILRAVLLIAVAVAVALIAAGEAAAWLHGG
jgi:hypothetical protein